MELLEHMFATLGNGNFGWFEVTNAAAKHKSMRVLLWSLSHNPLVSLQVLLLNDFVEGLEYALSNPTLIYEFNSGDSFDVVVERTLELLCCNTPIDISCTLDLILSRGFPLRERMAILANAVPLPPFSPHVLRWCVQHDVQLDSLDRLLSTGMLWCVQEGNRDWLERYMQLGGVWHPMCFERAVSTCHEGNKKNSQNILALCQWVHKQELKIDFATIGEVINAQTCVAMIEWLASTCNVYISNIQIDCMVKSPKVLEYIVRSYPRY